MTARPRVVYVLGAPRSGSTVLGDLAASIDGVHHIGEARFALDRGLLVDPYEGRPCGCGEPLRSCPFWAPHVGRTDAPTSSAVYDDVLRRARTELDARYVVDSSKTLEYLRAVSRGHELVLVVTTHRPLSDFVRSRQRHARRRRYDRRSDARLLAAAVADVVRWVLSRAAAVTATTVARRRGIPHVHVPLGALWADPVGVRADIARALGEEPGPSDEGDRTFTTGPTHAVWGSRSRVRPDGTLTIARRPDPGWTSDDK